MRLLPALGLLAAVLIAAFALWLYTPDKPRGALEADYAGPPSTFVQAAGLRLHVRDTGPRDAPVLVMLHGFGSSLHTWEAWAALLDSRYRVVRYDLPGFGLTGPDPTGDYSDERAETVLAVLMDSEKIQRATLIGNSLGGRLAWMFAASHPDRVDRLVLISPDGFASPGFEYGKKPDIPFFLRALPYVLPTALLRMNLAPAYADPARLSAATVTRYRNMMLVPGNRSALLARTAQVELHPPEPSLRRIAAPTLLLWGEQDRLIPIRNARDYLAAMPDARLVTLPGLGHVPMEEDPGRSIAPVLEFLKAAHS